MTLVTTAYDPSDNPTDLTCIEKGETGATFLLAYLGANKEHELFFISKTGRMTEDEFSHLVRSIAKDGIQYPVLVTVEVDGVTLIQEGFHRINAAMEAAKPVPVEVRYFGNSQERHRAKL